MEDTDLTDEQIREIANRKNKCPKCGNDDFLIQQPECDNCQDPKRLTIYDVDCG